MDRRCSQSVRTLVFEDSDSDQLKNEKKEPAGSANKSSEERLYFRGGPIVTKSGSDDVIPKKLRKTLKYYRHIIVYLSSFFSCSSFCIWYLSYAAELLTEAAALFIG
ncbi:hypothetical protein EVAR_74240_1 [Eumeta japonica]|uniref:Uncharacterized protein n=1 Tax=Eumeta variegata TaxID=151549 RepID=A0A4C1SF96_EUMVA|nr:hypothetical protein EVAR_74240_1 [Eumeta japonica]